MKSGLLSERLGAALAVLRDYQTLIQFTAGIYGWFVPQKVRREAWRALQELVSLRTLARIQQIGFRLGQAVILRSGGPVMEVIGFSTKGNVLCQWQQADCQIDEASFAPEMIVPFVSECDLG